MAISSMCYGYDKSPAILTISHSDLPNAIARAELLRERIKTRPPPNSGAHRLGSGVGGILDVEMGIDVAGHIE